MSNHVEDICASMQALREELSIMPAAVIVLFKSNDIREKTCDGVEPALWRVSVFTGCSVEDQSHNPCLMSGRPGKEETSTKL